MSELRACDRTPAARAARSACLSHGVSHGVWSVRWCAVRISHISYRARLSLSRLGITHHALIDRDISDYYQRRTAI